MIARWGEGYIRVELLSKNEVSGRFAKESP